jgi:DNA-binding HxlR family transcriptional regulator
MYAGRERYSSENCSIKRTLEIVGERWTLLVLRESFYGARRFEQFHSHVGCARNILSDRLATLVEHGLLSREPYRELGARQRNEYLLTEKGLDLFPAVIALMHWGDRWESDRDGPPVQIEHRDCGAPLEVRLRCARGHDDLSARDAKPVLGPAARVASAR